VKRRNEALRSTNARDGGDGLQRGPDGVKMSRLKIIMHRLLPALALTLLAGLTTSAFAVDPGEKLADPALEARARAIAAELRCLVCQNQSIDDSDAPLAKDLRLLLRERLREGASDEEAKAYIVARYGDFVLLRPPLKLETLLLWGAPLIALGGGGFALWRASRRRAAVNPSPLSEAEKAKLRALGLDPSGDA
jgi:cytochrome c-type biogenesis protein CcmH